jgi:hypothetical protein
LLGSFLSEVYGISCGGLFLRRLCFGLLSLFGLTLWVSLGHSLTSFGLSLGLSRPVLSFLGCIGFSWGSLGALWGFSLALPGTLGACLASHRPLLGLFWAALDLSGASLFVPLGPRGGKKATKCPKIGPRVAQEIPEGAKMDPPKLTCACLFLCLFWTPFRTPFRKVSRTPRLS